MFADGNRLFLAANEHKALQEYGVIRVRIITEVTREGELIIKVWDHLGLPGYGCETSKNIWVWN